MMKTSTIWRRAFAATGRTSLLRRVALGATLAAALAAALPAGAHGEARAGDQDLRKALAEVRRATLPFLDVQAATAANYTKFPDLHGDCVSQPGQGAMGIHYLNAALLDDKIEALRPEALMYQPTRSGKLELVGVEYIVFQPVWDALHPQPPALFGHPFHLVRTPNRYGTPMPFYELHLWLWEHNRDGLFNDWNPAVTCP